MQNGPWQNFNWRFYNPIHPFFCRTNLQPSNPKETTFSAGHLSIFVHHQLILSFLPQKLMDHAWWCMKASGRGGDKAIEGAGQNGGNGCIRRLTIEAGSGHADHARSYIHLSEVCALCNPTCISKHVEVCALQANSISKHLAGRGRAKCQQQF